MTPQPSTARRFITPLFTLLAVGLLCAASAETPPTPASAPAAAPALPPPNATPSARHFSTVLRWSNEGQPTAPAGFTVNRFAEGLDNPRWIYVAPNGDVLVAETNAEVTGIKKLVAKITGIAKSMNTGGSANRITLLRDVDHDGKPDMRETFLAGIRQPLGMLVLGDAFYVAGTEGVWRFPYRPGQTRLTGAGKKIIELPAAGINQHWTRNLVANADGSKLYVAIGSGSDHAEHGIAKEARRATILEFNPDGSGERVYASGLRNPVGLGWAPGTHTLWTVVNERDELGDELVPDYLTSVRDGAFYGWPYSYYGQHLDPRIEQSSQRPDLVAKALVPDLPLGSHVAALGLAFYTGDRFPEHYRGGAFIGEHGSWNRSQLSGYKVAFVPFRDGRPSGPPEDFLTGFVANPKGGTVYGRPVGVAMAEDGSLLVADDAGNMVWRVARTLATGS